ncbi:TonB-dependent receptor [Micavibrio aeruginosavorus EPB]|uniref:TonB-dependent receptor n=1 Tax=Micavibrio aeruginosavorus EPB TaxID=349215 RepID=M4VJX5_9BACT|nr:TonB-dependent receptor [Micavibrio aeruginosavorus EPB]
MTSQRRSERGNIFAALFGAVALIGVVGAASTALMRGPLSTVVTVNQRAKADTQMQLAAKLAIMEAAQQSAGGDCDADGYIEPLVPRGPSGSEPIPTNGGLIPGVIGATKTDPWGTEYGYCVWDMKDIGTGTCAAGLIDGPTVDAAANSSVVLAIISAGPDRAFQTACETYTANNDHVTQAGDDIVHTFTYDDARGLSDGLWTLKQGSPNVATIDKEIELSKAASFLSETSFQGGAKFDSGFLDLSAGGLMKLPTQATSGVCNVANTGVLRIDTSGGGQLLQICDPSADVILDPDGDKWVDIGGSGGVGGNIDGLTDGYSHGASRNLFLGSEDANLNVDPAQAISNVALGLGSGEAIVSGDNNTLLGNSAGYNITTGNNNVMIGSGAGGGVTTGSNNIIIGNSDALAAGTSNELRISNFIFGDISGGRLGIGGAPGAGYKLDVEGGTVNADRYEVAPNVFYSTSGSDLLLGTSNTTRLVIDSAGLVGIGMAPSEELDVAGDIRASESFYADEGNAGAPAYSFDGDADTGIFGSGAGDLAISTNGLQRLVVDSSGNVGIGEPSPGQALDVVGNGEFSGYVLGESFRVNSDSGLYEQGTGVSLNVGGAPALTVLASGEVGIGTTNPNMDLEVAGAIRIGDTANGCAAGTSGSIKYTSSGDALEYCSSDGNWYTIGASGGGGGGVGSPRISALQEAAATNIIDNANYTQTWRWDSLTTDNGLILGSSSITSGSILNIAGTNTGASAAALNVSTTSTTSGASAITGLASGAAGFVTGVIGQSDSGSGRGVYGYASATVGVNYGVQAISNGSNGYGLFARAASATGNTYGVYGDVNSPDGIGGYFQNLAGGWGLYSENDVGIGPNHYLNWGTTRGTTGYGIRDNNGIMEIKNSSGTWSPISSSSSVGGAPGSDSQVVYNSAGTLGADANFTWDRATARMGLGVASPTGRLQTGDTLYDTAVCPAGYVAGDFDGEGDVQDCVSVGLVVLPDGNVGVGTTAPNLMSAAREFSVSTGLASGAVGINLQGNVADGAAVGAIGAWNNSDLVSMIQFPHTGATGAIQFGVHNGTSMDLDAMILQSDGNIVLGDLAADAGLRLDVNGAVGATEYCDEDGLNCIDIADVSGAGGADTEVQFNSGGKLAGSPGFTWAEGSSALNVTGRVNITDRVNIAGQVGSAPQLMRLGDLTDVDTTGAVDGNAIIFDGTNWVVGTVGAGSIGAAGTDRQVQFNSNGALAADSRFVYTSAGDFIVGSYQFDDTTTGNEDARMVFNRSKGAFRAGRVALAQWDDANIGVNSAAFGLDTTASGLASFATGRAVTASGSYSFVSGQTGTASGTYSVAMGRQNTASGIASVALGHVTTASGANSFAAGNQTIASGLSSTAMGRSVVAGDGVALSGLGDGSLALGLIDDAVTITTPSQVTGIQSMGIFMGDQDGLVVSANNQMSLLGGTMVIDPRVPATNLTADTTFEVEGTIKISYSNEACDASREGSIRYMSNTDTFEVCAATASGWEEIGGNIEQVAGDPPVSNFVEDLNDLGDVVLSGSANGECLTYNGTNWINSACTSSAPSAAGADRQIQFNSNNSFAADANFVYTSEGSLIIGSSQMDDDSGSSDDNTKMFFDKDNAAFRAGFVGDDVFWDSANRGWASVALGQNTTASGQRAVAMGNFTQATGNQAFAVGENSIASGDSSMAFGADTEAGGYAATALGSTSRALGNRSLASGSASFAGGENSTALGHQTKASGYASTAMGTFSMATGEASTAMGEGTMATGRYGIAMGLAAVAGDGLFVGSDPEQGSQNPLVGEATMAIGLVTADNANNFLTVFPKVTGNQSLGIFMSAQEAVELADNNTMGLFGGKMVIDPRVPASNLSADTAFEVEGTIKIAYSGEACDASREGSIRYMSSTDTFEMCAVAANDWEAIGGGGTPGGVDTNVQFNSNGTLDGSSNFTWNEGTTTLDVNGVVSISDRLVLGGTAGNAPTYIALADLSDVDVSGVANGECLAYDGAQWTAAACGGGGGGATPGGADTYVQFNSNGALGGTADFTWDQGNTILSISGVVSVGEKIAMGGVAGNLPTYMGLNGLSDVDTTGVANGDALVYDGSEWVPGAAGATPGGANTYVQFNSNGELHGVAGFTWNNATTTLGVTGRINVSDRINITGQAGNAPNEMTIANLGDVALASPANGECLVYDGTNWENAACGGGGGGGAISGLTAATATNSINNGNYTQTWNWDSLTTETGLSLQSTSRTTGALLSLSAPATAGAGVGLLNINTTTTGGASVRGLSSIVTRNGGTSQNSSAVYGEINTVSGTNANGAAAVLGVSTGNAAAVSGVRGNHDGGGSGVMGTSVTGAAVFGTASDTSASNKGVYGSSASSAGYGVQGEATALSGTNFGVHGSSASATGYGVYGIATSTTGGAANYGVYGQSNGDTGRGVYGLANSATGVADGVFGQTNSTSGRGVYGLAVAGTGTTSGVFGQSASTSGRGITGYAAGASGATSGVWGEAASTTGRGVFGYNPNASGIGYGVYGQSGSSAGYGGYFTNTSTGVALHAQGDITYTGVLTDTSDIRLKTDIQQLDAQDVLARLDQIDTYSFRMRDNVSGQLELGVMAQEVEKVFPELVRTAKDEMGTKSVNYSGFVAPLIEATKTLKAENDNLKAELASLKTEQVAMMDSIDDLRADMNGMKAHTGYGIGKAGFGAGMVAGVIVILGGLGLAFMWNNTGLRRRRRAE